MTCECLTLELSLSFGFRAVVAAANAQFRGQLTRMVRGTCTRLCIELDQLYDMRMPLSTLCSRIHLSLYTGSRGRGSTIGRSDNNAVLPGGAVSFSLP